MAQVVAQATGEQIPVRYLKGVGPRRAAEFEAMGVRTLGDLLEYFPRDYQCERAERPISQLMEGQLEMARGQVIACQYVPWRGQSRFEATIEDPTGRLNLVWFHGAYLRRLVHPGLVLRVQGKVQFFRGMPQMVQPKWSLIEPDAPRVGQDLLRAVYPASARLPSRVIWQVIDLNLEAGLAHVQETLDRDLLIRRRLMGRPQALRAIHRPGSWEEAAAARYRLMYEELLLMQVGLVLSRRLRGGRIAAPVMRIDRLLDQRIRRRFPFPLTAAQERAILEILRDLRNPRPMSRLLQGDVGSGKTIVAVYAMLVAVANRFQAALLAPTEVLAEQHYLTLKNLLCDSSVAIGLFTQRSKRRGGRDLTRDLADGRIHIAVGTQALLQEDVEFARLGLVVVDEQHRLGVRQRAALRGKGFSPHYLVMTATPIPRTLALSYFADFDVSVLDEMPPCRQRILTRRVGRSQADEVYRFVREQVLQGQQAYIVVPQIEQGDPEEAASLKQEFERLSKGPLAGLRLAMLHGRMSTDEKNRIMTGFRAGQIDVLVATTVIEVGIDVPNATVMVVLDADRFGLSELHQIRGRVGRGNQPSHCLLVSDALDGDAEARLAALVRTADGFQIAEMDLKLRGPGDFFGVRQHGLPRLKLADITRELELLHQARDDALALLDRDPDLTLPDHQALRKALERQFGSALLLAQVG